MLRVIPGSTASPPKSRIQTSQLAMATYPITRPAIARPRPSNSGFALVRDNAMWPQTIPAIADIRKKPQQNPHKPRMLKISERTASCSVFRCGTTAAVVGTTGADETGVGVVALAAAPLIPGTVASAAQPAAPSYHA